jgi:glycolate oxidase FAD binding subunit
MADLAEPTSAEEIADLIAAAGASGRKLEVVGGGGKRAVGRQADADQLLSMAALDKVIDYRPEELVLTAQAGARLADLETLLAQHGQVLPFEPPQFAGLLGTKTKSTLGGALAANLSGPRRIKAGAARDCFLGFSGVSGRGEMFKSGGKVVKNVTGYDLCKLMAGSWGTLAVMCEVTIKVAPAPRAEATLLVFGQEARAASETMIRILNMPCEVSAAAYLPASTARRKPLGAEMAVTALRLEGFEASVAARFEAAARAAGGTRDRLDGAMSQAFWKDVREVSTFAKDSAPLWRISVPPSAGWRVAAALEGDVLYDWGGGLVWLLGEAAPADVRRVVHGLGGHAELWRGEAAGFDQPGGPLLALSQRVKAAFDPLGVLNPGRLIAGV